MSRSPCRTLKELTILRSLPTMRTLISAVLFADFLASSSVCLAASHSHAHRKAAAVAPRSLTKAHARSARAGKQAAAEPVRRSARTSTRKSAAVSARHRRGATLRRQVSLTRTRAVRRVEAPPPPPAPARSHPSQQQAAEAPIAHAPASTPVAAPPAAEPQPASTSAAVSAIPLHSPIVAMAPLRGSMESLVRQNEKTDADNLERIENDTDLEDRIAQGVLVPVPASAALVVNPSLPQNRRYCRPWTASFLADLARAHQAEFHHPFIVSSAVRTVEYQKRLMRTNGNAAAAEGDVASPHLTGATIDIAKSGLSRSEIFWMRNRLDALQEEGKIDVEEEFRQACFHITVYKSYVGAGPLHKPHHHAAPADDADTPASPPTEGQ